MVPAAVPRAVWRAMVELGEMVAMALRVKLELMEARMVSTEPQVVWAGPAEMAALSPRAPQATAVREATAVSPEPGALVSARLLQGQTVEMPVTADLVGLLEPVEQEAPPVMWLARMGMVATVVMVVSLVCRAMEATEPPVTRPPRMAAMAVRAVTPGVLELAPAEAQQEAVLAQPEPVERLALMAPLPQAVGMAGMAAQVSVRRHSERMEATAEMAEPVDHSATAAMGDLAAMAQSARREQLVRHPEIQALMAQSAEQAVAAGPADPVEQFQAMAVMVASRAMVEPEVLAEPASQARRGRIRETLAKPEGMEGMEPLAEPEGMVESEARPLELGLQVRMDSEGMEAMGEMLAWLEMAARVRLA